ncbi:hypothetical protein [Alicyclobacillus macrosporangiidus]|uniref:Uncharacterized protein n=1 Tax=Alicyclobacillus macrosporangiidus TaxID=392015 RepID=A0A1I7G7T5_9BACL|nr:hypothetical protein [Alicyclobacillus macrosporangiidus]SFU44411.1 hypothetical protein SAMN05421543_10247 [Alicyclobacillus macrosporangiidus]
MDAELRDFLIGMEQRLMQGMSLQFAEMERRLDEKIDARFADMERRFDEKMDARFDDLERRLDEKMDARFADMERCLDEKMDARFADMERRLDEKMDARFDEFRLEIRDMLARFSRDILQQVENKLAPLLQEVNEIHRILQPYQKDYHAVEGRLSICERRIDRHGQKIAAIEERLDLGLDVATNP